MPEFWNSGFPALLTFAGLIVTAVWGPKAVAKIQGKQKIKEIQTEGDSNAETLYVKNMSILLTEYKEQVSGFKEELKGVREEFAKFREQHDKDVEEYERQINYYKLEFERKDDKIDELQVIVSEQELVIVKKDEIIADLKGGE